MSNHYQRKVVKIWACQFENNAETLAVIRKKFGAKIELFKESAVTGGFISTEYWSRIFAFGDWILSSSEDCSPVIFDNDAFLEQYEPISKNS